MKTPVVFVSLLLCSASMDCGRATSTEANLRLLECVVRSFKETSGRLPTREEGLSVAVERPSDWSAVVEWTPLLETTELPHDGWGNDFVYVLDPNLPRRFGIYSCGQDGVTSSNDNDRDDINTWNDQAPWRMYYKLPALVTNRRLAIVLMGLILAAGILILAKGIASLRQPSQ